MALLPSGPRGVHVCLRFLFLAGVLFTVGRFVFFLVVRLVSGRRRYAVTVSVCLGAELLPVAI